MPNRAVRRTALAGAFIVTGLFSAGFTYRILTLKAAAARSSPSKTILEKGRNESADLCFFIAQRVPRKPPPGKSLTKVAAGPRLCEPQQFDLKI